MNSENQKFQDFKTAFELSVKLYNAGDIDAYFSCIHDDVVYYMPYSNTPVEGKAAVRAEYDKILSQADSAHWQSTDPEFIVNGTIGIVFSPFKHTVRYKDQTVRISQGRDTEVFTKTNGKWLKIFEHMSYFPEQEN